MITLAVVDGDEEGAENYETQQRLVKLFEKALQLQQEKALTYGDAYRSQGYMGNVARVLSKVARVRNMLWRDSFIATVHTSVHESVEDSLLDLINLAGFTLINLNDGNKWGK